MMVLNAGRAELNQLQAEDFVEFPMKQGRPEVRPEL